MARAISKGAAEAEVAISSEAKSAGQYHTFHQLELKSDFYYASDSVQLRQANSPQRQGDKVDTRYG